MRSEGYSTWSVCLSVCLFVCLSVCLSVDDYSRTTGYEAAYERYQQLQCYKGMKNNVAILLKRLRSRDMAWKQAKEPICKLALAYLDSSAYLGGARNCTAGRVSTPACCVATLWRTLSKLVRDHESKIGPARPPINSTRACVDTHVSHAYS